MKIYIASRFIDRRRLRPIADKIFSMGHDCISSWLQESSKTPYMTRSTYWTKLARKDIEEIFSCDLLIRDVHTISKTGGADTEWGIALARHQNCLLWLVGKPRNVFHYLADRVFTNWDQALKELKKIGPKLKTIQPKEL